MDLIQEGNIGLMQAVARHMIAAGRGGRIVNVTSSSAFRAQMVYPAYGSSKAGLTQLTRSAAADLGPHGINVNAVAPGWVMTDLSRGAREDPVRNAAIASRTPIGRWANTDEIADPVLFLCSDAARYMTGALVNVDGGYTAVG